MPQFATIDRDQAMQRVRRGRRGYDDRAPLREAIANLTAERMIELEPDEGESLRKIKRNVTRAAKEVGRHVAYGVSDDVTLLAWLERPRRRPGPRRGQGPDSR